MPRNSINIMHISDIHCGIDGTKLPQYKFEREHIIQAFHRDFNKIPSEWMPDVIAISGDIGWTGCGDDYEEFSGFLNELLRETRLDSGSVVCCAGNHDKYLPENYRLPRKFKGKSDFYSIDDIYSNLDILSTNFQIYSDKLKGMGIASLKNGSEIELSKYLYGYRIVKGLCFVVLNSAWLCDWRKDKKHPNADQNNLLLDVNIVCEMVKIKENLPPLPIIVMYHHPKEWLRNSEISSLDDIDKLTTIDYVEDMAHIILNGHTHIPKEEHSRQKLRYTAGTISSDDTYRSECRLIRIYVDDEDIDLSSVAEGRYYTRWKRGKVSWEFEGSSELEPFDAKAERNNTIAQLNKVKQKLLVTQGLDSDEDRAACRQDIMDIICSLTGRCYSEAGHDAERNEETITLPKTLRHVLLPIGQETVENSD